MGKEVVVSGCGWGCLWWGGWKLTHPVSVWHQISAFTGTIEQMKTHYMLCFLSVLQLSIYVIFNKLNSWGLSHFCPLFTPMYLWPCFICFDSSLLSQVQPFCCSNTKTLKWRAVEETNNVSISAAMEGQKCRWFRPTVSLPFQQLVQFNPAWYSLECKHRFDCEVFKLYVNSCANNIWCDVLPAWHHVAHQ